ncbi:MAG: tetratricopeptide repeat protein [Planctomycetales bacterium]|nr:tetratricopeptide repeat protein [Planctomycetales bacterium]
MRLTDWSASLGLHPMWNINLKPTLISTSRNRFAVVCLCGLLGFFAVLGCDRPTIGPQEPQPEPTPHEVDSEVVATVPIDPNELRGRVTEELSAGNIDSAYEHIRALMLITPDDPQAKILMARVLGERQRFPEAIRMLDRLSESSPEMRLPVLGQTAQWMVLQGDWVGAEKRYREILKEAPDAVMVHRELSRLLNCEGRRLEAVDHLREMCRQGNTEEFELRGLLRASIPFSGDAKNMDCDPIGGLGISRYMLAQSKWDEAIGLLVNSKNPTAAETALLGRIYAQRNDVEKLADWVAHWSPADRRNADAWYALGTHEANSGRHESAVRCFCEVVLLDPTDGDAYESLSRSLQAQHSDAEADEAARRSTLIQRTQSLGSEMAESDTRDLNKISELAELLAQLHRLDESLAWQAVQLAYSQSQLTTEQLKQRMMNINRERLEILESGKMGATESFILCGVDLQSLRSK